MDKTVSSAYFASIVQIWETMGLKSSALYAAIKFDPAPLSDIKYRVDLETLIRAFDFAEKALEQPNIGLQTGFRFRIYTFAETGSVLAYSRTLGEAVEINVAYNILVETVGQSELSRREGGDYMVWKTGDTDPNWARHVTELVMAGYAATAQWLTWSFSEGLDCIYFRHKAPNQLSDYAEILKCEVLFEQPENSVGFVKDIIDRPLPSGNSEKLAITRQRLDAIMAKVAKRSDLKDKLKIELILALKDSKPIEAEIAKKLGLSARSLRRHLAGEGLTFRGVLDETRRSLCHNFMRDGLSLTDITHRLQYSDQPAFIRAFKRWHGVTPTQFSIDNESLTF